MNLIFLLQIFEDHYHFSHSGVAKRSLKPNSEKRARLAVDTRVKWAQQQKAKKRVKRDLKLQDFDPQWPSMWYLVSIFTILPYICYIFVLLIVVYFLL